MFDNFVSFLSQVLMSHAFIVLASVFLAFYFNAYLQKKLLAKQNKDKFIDMLINLLEEQKRFYAKYWEQNAADIIPINQTMQITRFNTMLDFAEETYNINNMGELKKEYREFYLLATGDDFDSPHREADIKKSKLIHIIANNLYGMLWKNKI